MSFSLETMCNYLTTSLQSVQGSESSEALPDFRSEISLYENAMEQLKTRYHQHCLMILDKWLDFVLTRELI